MDQKLKRLSFNDAIAFLIHLLSAPAVGLFFFFSKYLVIYLTNVFGFIESWWQHVGSSFLIRDGTWMPCNGSVESQPLGHQGSPRIVFLIH